MELKWFIVDANGNPCTLTCLNGGACQNDTGTATCNCVNAYSGSTCENGKLKIFFMIHEQYYGIKYFQTSYNDKILQPK